MKKCKNYLCRRFEGNLRAIKKYESNWKESILTNSDVIHCSYSVCSSDSSI